MVSSLSYRQAAADIVKMSAAGGDPGTQKLVGNMCQVFCEFLNQFTERTDGYMILAALHVSFAEMKKVIAASEGTDKQLLEQLVLAIVGSFGSTIN